MNHLEFKPTKEWITDHQERPAQCPDKECYCILDHINEHQYGFCTGIKLNNQHDLDIISFCTTCYTEDPALPEAMRYLWHPNEAQLIATYLIFTVSNAWSLLPNHRKQLGTMLRRRTRQLHKREKKANA